MENYTRLKIYNSSLITVFLFVVTSLNAQYSADFLKYSKLHPEEARIRLQQETIITIETTKEGLEINQEFIEEDLYLDESATYGSKRNLRFSSFFELESVEASSYEYKDGKYRTHKVEEFLEKDEMDDNLSTAEQAKVSLVKQMVMWLLFYSSSSHVLSYISSVLYYHCVFFLSCRCGVGALVKMSSRATRATSSNTRRCFVISQTIVRLFSRCFAKLKRKATFAQTSNTIK